MMVFSCEQLVPTCTAGQRDRKTLLSTIIQPVHEKLDRREAEQLSLQLKGSVVYFVDCPSLNQIKIGTTKNIRYRFSDLQVGCPHRLKLLRAVYGGEREEGWLHALFAGDRTRGEWFEGTPELRALIESMMPGVDFESFLSARLREQPAAAAADLAAGFAE